MDNYWIINNTLCSKNMLHEEGMISKYIEHGICVLSVIYVILMVEQSCEVKKYKYKHMSKCMKGQHNKKLHNNSWVCLMV